MSASSSSTVLGLRLAFLPRLLVLPAAVFFSDAFLAVADLGLALELALSLVSGSEVVDLLDFAYATRSPKLLESSGAVALLAATLAVTMTSTWVR